MTAEDLRAFFRAEYGAEATAKATFDPAREPEAAMAALKDFLLWFKAGFPYYKSACLHCGHNGQGNRMLGVVAPSAVEREVNATLTEVYCCGDCGRVYRFPRAVALARCVALVGLEGEMLAHTLSHSHSLSLSLKHTHTLSLLNTHTRSLLKHTRTCTLTHTG